MFTSPQDTWSMSTGRYLLCYAIKRNSSPVCPDEILYEYGIECTLTEEKSGEILSLERINCISPDYDKVFKITQILKKFEVFPAHLKDIVSDLLLLTAEEQSRLLCVR